MSVLLRFGIVGATCAALNLLVLFVGTGVLGMDYLVSVTLAFFGINYIGFMLNKHFAFRNTAPDIGVQAFRYYVVLAVSLAANLALMMFLVEIVGVNYILASVVVTVLFAGLNFVGHLRVTFASRR